MTIFDSGNSLPYYYKEWYSEPVTHWPDAKAAVIQHESTLGGLHKECIYLYLNFLERMSAKVEPVNVLLGNKLKKTIEENGKRLIPIIDTFIYCGHNGLPLMGDRDDSKYHPEIALYSTGGVGLFNELLNYRVRGGDHLKNHSKNASYISKTVQNELIKCCGDVVCETILTEVWKNKFFGVIADEAADCSNKERMSLVLRYVDSENNIREDFLRFLHCHEGLSGADLAKKKLTSLSDDLVWMLQLAI